MKLGISFFQLNKEFNKFLNSDGVRTGSGPEKSGLPMKIEVRTI